MPSVNLVVLTGNLTRDVELRYTPAGAAVADFGMAINDSYIDKRSNEKVESTVFVDVSVFGRQAETCKQYLVKGAPVLLEGKLKFDQWEDKQTGAKRSKLKVTAMRVQFLGRAGDGASAPSSPSGSDQRPAETPGPGANPSGGSQRAPMRRPSQSQPPGPPPSQQDQRQPEPPADNLDIPEEDIPF